MSSEGADQAGGSNIYHRPQLQRRSASARGLSNVWAVVRRELGARLFTSGYFFSTIAFAAMSFASPLLFTSSDADAAPVVALTHENAVLSSALAAGGLNIDQVRSREAGQESLRDGSADALLLTRETDEKTEWILVSESSIDLSLVKAVQDLLTMDALSALALDAGVSPESMATGITQAVLSTETLEADGGTKWAVILALIFGAITVFVILLWGATMASDVVQEKATRVVEIVIATIKPWQLLAGKVVAITIVGLLQIGLVIAAAYAGLELFAGGLDLSAMAPEVLATGLVGVLIGVPLLAMLMAAMAARVEHQDDLGTAIQPVYLLLMLPFAATVYVGLNTPDGLLMGILSIAPITNIFAMPVRVAATIVPSWQIGLSLAVGILTLFGSILLAGRIYSNSILRSGTTVSLRQSLARQ